jgi:lipoprotein-anchoring transpeptidase ErfK/SrfK
MKIHPIQKTTIIILIIITFHFTCMFFNPPGSTPSQVQAQATKYIIIHGNSYKLDLYDENGTLIKKYPIGVGQGGLGKNREGDRKTPLGEYRILWKASRFHKTDGGHPIRDGAAFCGPNNSFTTDPKIGYPSEQLWTDGYGGDRAVVMCLDYPNAQDKARGYTGGCIEIHATLLGGIGKNSSYGCIRLSPDNARDLYNRVTVDTKVTIKND